MLDAGGGAIRMVTIAPERDGALAAIRQIVDAGVVAAVGHTEATYEQTRAAIEAGATVGTHLFNAMRPIHHREPGPVIALLEDTAGDRRTDHRRCARRPRAVPPRPPQRGTGPGVAGDRRDGGDRDGRRRLPAGAVGGGLSSTASHAWPARTPSRAAPRPWTGCSDSPSTHCGLPRDEALMAAVRQASINPARALGLPSAGWCQRRRGRPGGAGRRPRRDRCAAPWVLGGRATNYSHGVRRCCLPVQTGVSAFRRSPIPRPDLPVRACVPPRCPLPARHHSWLPRPRWLSPPPPESWPVLGA